MTSRALCALTTVLALGIGALGVTPAWAEDVPIPDAALRACISHALGSQGLPSDLSASNLAAMGSLTCDSSNGAVADLSGIEHLTGLGRLTVVEADVADISPLSGLPALTSVILHSAKPFDFTPLATLPGLEKLSVTLVPEADPAPLARLGSLRLLDVAGTSSALPAVEVPPGVTEFSVQGQAVHAIAGVTGGSGVRTISLYLPHLRSLDGVQAFQGATGLSTGWSGAEITDLAPLAGLTGLTSLTLSGNHISDLAPLAGLTGLTSLDLSGNQVTDLTPLAGLTALTRLELARNQIVDVTALSGLASLNSLQLATNEVADLSPLSGLDRLATLGLAANHLTDVSALARVSSLASLGIGTNELTDIAPLAQLPALTRLDASTNRLTDLGPDGAFRRLESATLNQNELTSIAGLSGARLQSADLMDNRISDVTPLSDVSPSATVRLQGNRVKDLSPLPDTVTFDAEDQQLTYGDASVGVPFDLAIRDVAGSPLCPVMTGGASCSDGNVTYPASGSYQGWVQTKPSGWNNFTARFTQHAGPDRAFTRTYAPTVGMVPLVGYSVQPRYKQWSPTPYDYTYQWYRDGQAIPDDAGHQFNYTIVADDLGHRLSVCVTGHLNGYTPQTRCSGPSAKVRKGDVWFTGPPKVAGTPRTDATLTVTAAAFTDGVTFHYQWQRNGRNISGATATTYAVLPGDVGARIRVRVKGTGAGLNSVTKYSTSVIVHKALLVPVVPTISGDAKVGSTLTADAGTWSPAPVKLGYQWYRNTTAIGGAHGSTYVLAGADFGKLITVTLTATKPGYYTSHRTSPPTAAVLAA